MYCFLFIFLFFFLAVYSRLLFFFFVYIHVLFFTSLSFISRLLRLYIPVFFSSSSSFVLLSLSLFTFPFNSFSYSFSFFFPFFSFSRFIRFCFLLHFLILYLFLFPFSPLYFPSSLPPLLNFFLSVLFSSILFLHFSFPFTPVLVRSRRARSVLRWGYACKKAGYCKPLPTLYMSWM